MKDNEAALVDTYLQVFQAQPKEQIRKIQGAVGSGLIRRIGALQDVIISECQMRFYEETYLTADTGCQGIALLFCLSNGVGWNAGRRHLEMGRDEVLIASANRGIETVCYAPDNSYHFITITMKETAINRLLCPSLADSEYKRLKSAAQSCHKDGMTPQVHRAIRQLTQCPYAGAAAKLYQESKLLELFSCYLGGILSTEKCCCTNAAGINSGIQKAIALLEEDPFEDWSLARIAKACYLSESGLTRGFRKVTGQSVHQYLINRRMDAARVLLERQALTVSEAARRIGYTNMSHFASAYKRRFGINPGMACKQCVVYCPDWDDD